MSDFPYILPPPQPFRFISSELSADLLRAEIAKVNRLIEQHPELRNLFDAPEATVSQRKFCFALLAHREVMGIIYELFAGRYEQAPSFGEEESNARRSTDSLVTSDAPDWTLEANRVVEALPHHLFNALPEPLRVGVLNSNDAAQMESIGSAKNTLSTVEQLQTLIEKVLDQQLGRLEKRWLAGTPAFQTQHLPATKTDRPKGTEGLVRKNDLSQYSHYMDNFTEKQRLAFVLKFEYGLGLAEIASRMRIDRKTADEHIKAAERKVEQGRSSEKRRTRRAKNTPEF